MSNVKNKVSLIRRQHSLVRCRTNNDKDIQEIDISDCTLGLKTKHTYFKNGDNQQMLKR